MVVKGAVRSIIGGKNIFQTGGQICYVRANKNRGGHMPNRTLVTSVVIALIISIGLFCIGYFTGNGFYKSRMNDRYVTVKGLSERDVSADLAIWNIKLVSTGDDLTAVQDKIEKDKQHLLTFLNDNEIANTAIEEGQFNVVDLMAERYRTEQTKQNRYIINYNVTVRSNEVAKIGKVAAKTGELLKQGLVLTDNVGPTYVFTKLNDIKPAMIAEATKSARISAEQFALDSGSKVGSIRRASQGIFSISAKNSSITNNDQQQYADPMNPMNNEALQVDKKIRVVSTIDYYLVK